MRFFTIFCLVLFCAFAARAQFFAQSPLTIDLAHDSVDITMGFNGADLVVFGTRKNPGDIAIVIRGPEVPAVVRRKAQAMGIWMNTQSVAFRNVPAYYDLALSRGEFDIDAPEALMENRIGLNTLDFRPDTRQSDETVRTFKEALIRHRQVQGYFPLEPRRINFLSEDFFRADFRVPPNVPAGDYVIQTYLIEGGKVQDKRETRLRVAQVGFNARLYSFAQHNGVAYGLLSVFIAILAGWASHAFLRRD